MPNLLIQRNKPLYFNIHSYNKLVEKQALQMSILEEKAMQICQKLQIQELDDQNENINKLFSQAKNKVFVILDLFELNL